MRTSEASVSPSFSKYSELVSELVRISEKPWPLSSEAIFTRVTSGSGLGKRARKEAELLGRRATLL